MTAFFVLILLFLGAIVFWSEEVREKLENGEELSGEEYELAEELGLAEEFEFDDRYGEPMTEDETP